MALDENAPTIYPTLRYDDAPAAIRFLTGTLGLVAGDVFENPDGTVAHAQLSWGTGVVMLYLAVADPDAHHARAVAAGAEVVMELTDQDYGSREFAVRDPEDNRWCFGTYQPAATAPVPVAG